MIAVIDIGTNTFHLLIASIVDEDNYDIVYRESVFVRIAKDGIDPISTASLSRAEKTLGHFVEVMKKYEINKIRVVGTEALRSASNGHELLSIAKEKFGLTIEIISGEEEAKLIYEGTVHAIPVYQQPYLIMDIGGGSVEFIMAQDGKILWWGSYKIGVQYLFLKYKDHDPISLEDLGSLRDELDINLKDLKLQIDKYKPTRLVGSSGSFETLLSLAGVGNNEVNYVALPTPVFEEIFSEILNSTLEQRKSNPAIPKDRAELIVIGFLLIDFVLDLFKAQEIIVSSFALREGLLYSDQKYGKLSI